MSFFIVSVLLKYAVILCRGAGVCEILSGCRKWFHLTSLTFSRFSHFQEYKIHLARLSHVKKLVKSSKGGDSECWDK